MKELNQFINLNLFISISDGVQYRVHFGAYLASQVSQPPSRTISVKKAIPHPNFNPDNFMNDIALFILETDVELDSLVQVACLPNRMNEFYPESVNISAWIGKKMNKILIDLRKLG